MVPCFADRSQGLLSAFFLVGGEYGVVSSGIQGLASLVVLPLQDRARIADFTFTLASQTHTHTGGAAPV